LLHTAPLIVGYSRNRAGRQALHRHEIGEHPPVAKPVAEFAIEFHQIFLTIGRRQRPARCLIDSVTFCLPRGINVREKREQ
jgi:hypothetical protein